MSLTRTVAINATALAVLRAVMAAIGVITVGVMTRYLGVEAYGSFATANAVIMGLGTLTDVGLWTIGAREIAKRPHETQRIFSSVLTVGLAMSAGAAVVGVALAFLVYGDQGDELVRRGILLLMLTMPLTAPFGAANAYFISQQKAYLGQLASLLASVVTIAVVVLAAALDWGYTWIVGAFVVAAASQAFLVIGLSMRSVRMRPTLDLSLGKQLFLWAVPLGAAMAIYALYWRMDTVLLSLFEPKSEVALYALSIKVVEAVIVLPGYMLVTLLPELARLTNEPVRFQAIQQKAFAVIQVAAVGMFVLFAGFAPEITTVIGGGEFDDAGPVLRILMLAFVFTALAGVVAQGFVVHNRQRVLVLVAAGLLVFNLALNLVLIPLWAARGSAAASAATEALHLLALVVLYSRFATPPRFQRASRVLAAGAAMAAILLIKLLPFAEEADPVVVLAVGVPATGVLYFVALYALRAMPEVVHTNVVLPLWGRVRSRRAS